MKIGIIGGGASGMMAALTAAQSGAKVTILEKNDRIGKKILATGNGKCNFSNLSFSNFCYYSNDKPAAEKIFENLTPVETVSLFEKLGMRVKEKNGFLYPASEQAATLLDILRFALEDAGVKVVCNADAVRIDYLKNFFAVQCRDGNSFRFDKLILTCGGQAAPKTGSDGSGFGLAQRFGHQIYEPVPALVQLRCQGGFWKSISGIRCDAELTLLVNGVEKARERGELQVTDYGISGIVVFQFSRIAAYALAAGKKTEVLLDLLPTESIVSLHELSEKRYQQFKQRTAEAFFTGLVQKKWMQYFMKIHGFKPDSPMMRHTIEQVENLLLHMKCFKITVEEPNSFAQAQVCAGGVSLAQVQETLESNLVKGLFFAGEILDVDGKCGGYNLQWAWSSGYTAGREAARKTME